MDDVYAPEEIDALADRAGLRLPPAWRAELIRASRHVAALRRRLRRPRDMSAEPAHLFSAAEE